MTENSAARTRHEAEFPVTHKSVDRESITHFVHSFYTAVRRNPRLGPIFARQIGDDWAPHLEKMTNFWCAVILKLRCYDGRPVPAHTKLTGVQEDDFEIWLDIFRSTARQAYPEDIAEIFIVRAERIAQSLQLAMFFRLPAADEATSGGDDITPPSSAGPI